MKKQSPLTPLGSFAWYALVSGLAVALVVLFAHIPGCRATFPVTISNVNNNCESEIHNADGSIDYQSCRVDGSQPSKTGGSPGDENISVPESVEEKVLDHTSSIRVPYDVRMN